MEPTVHGRATAPALPPLYPGPHVALERAHHTADAFVLVMPEYNHGFNAPLKNAIDYLVHEWAFKPVGFVSYGGVAVGTRAVQLLKQVLVGLKMTPIVEAVNIPFVSRLIKDGALQADESMAKAAQVMLTEVQRTEEALRGLRLAAREPQPARS